MTATDGDDAGARSFTVDLSPGAVLGGSDGVERVVIKHVMEPDGSVSALISEGGEVRPRRLRDLLVEQAANFRLTSNWIAPDPNSELLNWISKEKRQLARERECHVIDVLNGRSGPLGSVDPRYDAENTTETERRRAKNAELGEKTDDKLGRWLRDYKKGGAIRLAGHVTRHLRSVGAAEVSPEILAIVRDHFRDSHLGSKKSLLNEHALVLAELRRRGLVGRVSGMPGPGGTSLPLDIEALSYDTFKRLLQQLKRGRNPRTAKTRQQQSNRPKVNGVRHRGLDFADRVEMDSTKIDFQIWTPDGPLRVWAVFAVCTSTRYLWVRLVPTPPRGIHLALLLWDMIGGDGLWSGDTGGTPIPVFPANIDVNAWIVDGDPPAALPGCVVLDHGAEEENGYFISICAILGIQVRWARTMQPTDKAYIESQIRKFAEFCQLLPGHTGNTVENRPHRESQTLLWLPAAQAAVRTWCRWVATQPHTGLAHDLAPQRHLTPLEAVTISLNREVPIRVLADPTLPLRLLKNVSLIPEDDGVTWQKRRYTCSDFEDLVTVSSARGPRRRLTFYYDPDAPGWLYWPRPGTFNVRILHAPGPASGVVGSFQEVRHAMLKSLTGQKWPTHNEMVSRRADLLDLLTGVWHKSGLEPQNVVPLERARKLANKWRQDESAAAEHSWNSGWALDDFDDALEDCRTRDIDDDATNGDHDQWGAEG